MKNLTLGKLIEDLDFGEALDGYVDAVVEHGKDSNTAKARRMLLAASVVSKPPVPIGAAAIILHPGHIEIYVPHGEKGSGTSGAAHALVSISDEANKDLWIELIKRYRKKESVK